MPKENPHEALSHEQIGLQPLQVQRRLGLDTGALDNYNHKQGAEGALKEISDLLVKAVELKQDEKKSRDLKELGQLFEEVKAAFRNNNVDLLFRQPTGRQQFVFVDKWVAYMPPESDLATWPNIELALTYLAIAIQLVKEKDRAYKEHSTYVPSESLQQVTAQADGVASVQTLVQESIKHILANPSQF